MVKKLCCFVLAFALALQPAGVVTAQTVSDDMGMPEVTVETDSEELELVQSADDDVELPEDEQEERNQGTYNLQFYAGEKGEFKTDTGTGSIIDNGKYYVINNVTGGQKINHSDVAEPQMEGKKFCGWYEFGNDGAEEDHMWNYIVPSEQKAAFQPYWKKTGLENIEEYLQSGRHNCPSIGAEGDAWLKYTPLATGTHDIKITSSIGYTTLAYTYIQLYVYQGTPYTNYLYKSEKTGSNQITRELTAGTTYYFRFVVNKKDTNCPSNFDFSKYKYTFTVPEVQGVTDLSTATVTGISSSYAYTGSAIKPNNFTVKCGNTKLAAGTDYTVEYGSNINVGTGSVTIKAKSSSYTGSKTINFTIYAASIESASVAGISSSYPWTGNAIKPAVTAVTLNGRTLVNDTDYMVSYGTNTAPGQGTVTITGKGNYEGTKTIKFTIAGKTHDNDKVPPSEITATKDQTCVRDISLSAYPGWTWKAPDTVLSGTIITSAEYTADDKDAYDSSTNTVSVTITKAATPVTGINLSKSTLELVEGASSTLTATVLPDDADNKAVTWSSSAPAIASVDNNGLVVAKAQGTATITVTSTANSSIKAECKVTVNPKPIVLTGINISPTSMDFASGSSVTKTIIVSPVPSGAALGTVTYTSDNTGVAKVSTTGVVTPTGAGTATITVACGGFTKTCTVSVSKPKITDYTIKDSKNTVIVSGAEISLYNGDPYSLSIASTTPSDPDSYTVEWTSSASAVASVTASADGKTGTITTKQAGTTMITVKVIPSGSAAENAIPKTFTINVTEKDTSVTLTGITASVGKSVLNKGETTDVEWTKTPVNASVKSVSYEIKSENPSGTVEVNKEGKVTAKKTGTATIKVTVTDKKGNSKWAECTVTVKTPVTGITLNKSKILVKKGSTDNLSATVEPSDADDKTVTWTSSKTDVAAVDSTGTVTAKAVGTTTITATCGGKSAQCTVEVEPKDLTGIAISPQTLSFTIGDAAKKITASPVPSDAVWGNVTFYSDKEGVAVVDSEGMVTPKGAGTANITASYSGKKATCTVTVVKPQIKSYTIEDAGKNSITDGYEKSLYINDTWNLNIASKTPADPAAYEVTWTSSKPGVVQVNKNGEGAVITAKAEGEADVTVSVKGTGDALTKTFKVKVQKRVSTNQLEGVSITAWKYTLTGKDTIYPEVAPIPSSASYDYSSKVLTSSDETVVKINSYGGVEAVGPGTAKVTVTVKDSSDNSFSASCTFIVSAVPVTYFDISVDRELFVGESSNVEVSNFQPWEADDSDKVLTWENSNPDVVTLNGNKITAKKAGKATITATTKSGGFAKEVEITVIEKELTGVEVTPANMEFKLGVSDTPIKISVTPQPADAPLPEVTFDSTDDKEKIITVSEDGTVTPVGKGKATITVTCGKFEELCTVTVTKPQIEEYKVVGLAGTEIVANSTKEMYTKDNWILSIASVVPENADDYTVEWSSSDEDVAQIESSNNGEQARITAMGAGNADITVSVKGVEAEKAITKTYKVNVKGRDISEQLTGISISLSKSILKLGDYAFINIETIPENAAYETISYNVEPAGIVQVGSYGNVIALEKGEAVITATATFNKGQTYTADCKVTVATLVTDFELSGDKNFYVGESKTFEAHDFLPGNADESDKVLTWTSDNTSVATVDETGKVTAKGKGTAVISAKTPGGCIRKLTITVKKKAGGEAPVVDEAWVISRGSNKLVLKQTVYDALEYFVENNGETVKTGKAGKMSETTIDGLKPYTFYAIRFCLPETDDTEAGEKSAPVNVYTMLGDVTEIDASQISYGSAYMKALGEKGTMEGPENPIAVLDNEGKLKINKAVTLNVSKGSYNIDEIESDYDLTISGNGTMEVSYIETKGNLTIDGSTVNIDGNDGKPGIKAKDVNINQAKVTIYSAADNNCIAASGSVSVKNSQVTANTSGEAAAIKAGELTVEGSKVLVGAGADVKAIDSEKTVIIGGDPAAIESLSGSVDNLFTVPPVDENGETVDLSEVRITEIILSVTEKTVNIGESFTILATINPENATNKRLEWSISDTSVASVYNGSVRGLSVGTATITVSATDRNKVQATCVVHVKEKSSGNNNTTNPKPVGKVNVTSVSISSPTKKLAPGKKLKLIANVAPSNASNKAVEWRVDNTKYAVISADGTLTAKTSGKGKKVTVTAVSKDNGSIKGTCTISIMKQAVKKITLSGKKTLKKGKSTTIKAKFNPTKNISKELVWTSSKPKVATVSSKGKVTAKKKGKTKITAKAKDGSGKKASITITVK